MHAQQYQVRVNSARPYCYRKSTTESTLAWDRLELGKRSLMSFQSMKQPTVQKPTRSKELEQRLKKLEAIVNALNLNENDELLLSPSLRPTNQAPTVVPASPSVHPSFPSYVDQPRLDLQKLFFSTGAGYMFLTEQQALKALYESVFLRFAIYSVASTVAPPSMVTVEFGNRQEMGEVYFRRAESFLRRVFKKPSYHGVIGLFALVIYCTRIIC